MNERHVACGSFAFERRMHARLCMEHAAKATRVCLKVSTQLNCINCAISFEMCAKRIKQMQKSRQTKRVLSHDPFTIVVQSAAGICIIPISFAFLDYLHFRTSGGTSACHRAQRYFAKSCPSLVNFSCSKEVQQRKTLPCMETCTNLTPTERTPLKLDIPVSSTCISPSLRPSQ